MYYSEQLEIRKPLVIATPEQLNRDRVLRRVQRHASRTILRSAMHPDIQFAVACEDKLTRTRVSTLALGRYVTAEQVTEAGGWLPKLDYTPEKDVYYQSLMTGNTNGLISTHAENYVGRLRALGAQIYDARSLLINPQNPQIVPMVNLLINQEEY